MPVSSNLKRTMGKGVATAEYNGASLLSQGPWLVGAVVMGCPLFSSTFLGTPRCPGLRTQKSQSNPKLYLMLRAQF
jgi:hypothetical protein